MNIVSDYRAAVIKHRAVIIRAYGHAYGISNVTWSDAVADWYKEQELYFSSRNNIARDDIDFLSHFRAWLEHYYCDTRLPE
jgi:hypothetical protein